MNGINTQEPTAAEYIKATQKLSEYSIDGDLCFHNELLVGGNEKGIVIKMKEMQDEIEYWSKIGEKEEVRIATRQFVDYSRKLR